MKPLLFSFLSLVVFSCTVNAQDFVPFAKFTSEEATMKECSFDTEAEAIVLLHEANSNYDESYQLITKHHIRVKILKEKGIEDNANVSIDYWRDGDFENIRVTRAATINTNAAGDFTVLNVDKKSVYDHKINEKIGEVSFAFPDVKVGSILEYEYESIRKHYGGLEDWYFQEERPVLRSCYKLVIVPNAEFAYQVVKRIDFDAIVKANDNDYSVYFEMSKIPGLRYEPYIDARKDYLQKVWIQLSRYRTGDGFGGTRYMTSWEEVNRELITHESFGRYISKSVPGTDEYITHMKAIPDELLRMKEIFEKVRKSMEWNRMFAVYVSDGFKAAWEKKTGTSAEINVILINLLKEAGLTVAPVLVSYRSQGKVDAAYPFIGQFHSVIARVTIGTKFYYLDAIDEYTPCTMTTDDLLNTSAFVLDRKKGQLVEISDESVGYQETIFVDATVTDDGIFNGRAEVSSAGYAKSKKLEDLLSKGELSFTKQYFNSDKINLSAGNLEIRDKENDSLPLFQNVHFNAPLTQNGDYLVLPVNLFSGFTSNPFISDNRFSNINLGYRKNITLVFKATLPPSYDVDELPKAVKMVTPGKEITMTRVVEYNKDERTVNALLKVDFTKNYYVVDDYPVLKEFYKKLIDFLNEPVVLKKK